MGVLKLWLLKDSIPSPQYGSVTLSAAMHTLNDFHMKINFIVQSSIIIIMEMTEFANFGQYHGLYPWSKAEKLARTK